MKFKKGDYVKVNIKNIKIWADRFRFWHEFENRNKLLIINHAVSEGLKCNRHYSLCMKKNKCPIINVKYYVESSKEGYSYCEKDLIKATDREIFLFKIYGKIDE